MKARILSVLLIIGISSLTLFAGNKTEKFKVEGNCGMCETRIENAAKAVEGVASADWDQKTRMIKVKFDKEITDITAVQKAIAKAGHDTGKFTASDEVYDKLPGCCKYERETSKKASPCCEDAESSCAGEKSDCGSH